MAPAIVLLFLLCLTGGLAPFAARGAATIDSPTPPARLSTNTSAVPKEQVTPYYPESARVRGQEGWVQLSFVIGADGRVVDPIIEASSGQKIFERAALDAAIRQRYLPATVDGQPVEQVESRIIYIFGFSDRQLSARPEFGRRYAQLRRLLDKNDLNGARNLLDELDSKGTWNLYEASRLHLVRYKLCQVDDDKVCMLRSLKQAAGYKGINYLELPVYRDVLRRMAELQIEELLYAAALTTIETLNGLQSPLPPDDPLMRAAADIRTAIEGDDDLVFDGRIADQSAAEIGRPHWRHQLLRREFAVIGLDGNVEKVEIRCKSRRTSDFISDEKAWRIPTNWGPCDVFVFGDAGATLKLIELPLAPPSDGIAPGAALNLLQR